MTKPNYYSILPASVRYDKNLNSNEKVLYSEISALTNKTGECWASNTYFAELYDVTPQAISKWIKNIEDRGYISTSYQYKQGTKMIEKRIIHLVSICVPRVSTHVDGGINTRLKGYQHTIKDNNTSINNTSINKYIGQVEQIPYKEVIDYLNDKANKGYRNTRGHQRHIRARFNEGYTLDDFKVVIDIKTSHWLNDPKMDEFLRPETLFGTKFDTYLNQKPKEKEVLEEIGKVW